MWNKGNCVFIVGSYNQAAFSLLIAYALGYHKIQFKEATWFNWKDDRSEDGSLQSQLLPVTWKETLPAANSLVSFMLIPDTRKRSKHFIQSGLRPPYVFHHQRFQGNCAIGVIVSNTF